MTPFSLLAPAIARDVLDHALALGADFAELFVERKRRSQHSKNKGRDNDDPFGIQQNAKKFA